MITTPEASRFSRRGPEVRHTCRLGRAGRGRASTGYSRDLDIIFNHSGFNWLYDSRDTGDAVKPKYTPGQYHSLFPKNGFGSAITNPQQPLVPPFLKKGGAGWRSHAGHQSRFDSVAICGNLFLTFMNALGD
jgi:hypothetical protein